MVPMHGIRLCFGKNYAWTHVYWPEYSEYHNKLPARYASTWAWFTNMLLWTKWYLLSSRYCPNVQRWMSSFGIQKRTRGHPVGRQFPQMLLFVPGGSTCSIPITEERIKGGEWGWVVAQQAWVIWTKILCQICKLPIKAGLGHGTILAHCDKLRMKALSACQREDRSDM